MRSSRSTSSLPLYSCTSTGMLRRKCAPIRAMLSLALWPRQDAVERMIAYGGRALSRAQSNYSTTKKESFAVVWVVTKFRHYSHGRPFRVVSYHHCLCWMASLRGPLGQPVRWGLKLQHLYLAIVHKSEGGVCLELPLSGILLSRMTTQRLTELCD